MLHSNGHALRFSISSASDTLSLCFCVGLDPGDAGLLIRNTVFTGAFCQRGLTRDFGEMFEG
jgi:hypothetical protein